MKDWVNWNHPSEQYSKDREGSRAAELPGIVWAERMINEIATDKEPLNAKQGDIE